MNDIPKLTLRHTDLCSLIGYNTLLRVNMMSEMQLINAIDARAL